MDTQQKNAENEISSDQSKSLDSATSDAQLPLPIFTPPSEGEAITSEVTRNTYRIGRVLGSGNFGVVYECSDTWNNQLAVKVLQPKGTYEHIRDQAIAEYQKLMLLRHPNITYVHDAFEYRHTFYIVFERCAQSVADMVQRENFNGRVWLPAVSRCVLQALHFIHVNGFAHQDIHAGNVLSRWIADEVLPEEHSAITFKVADLGISKLVSEMDATNTILADWMRAPESLDPGEFGAMDHRMDIYHCGLLLLQVLLGRTLTFTRDEVLAGRPRGLALELEQPYRTAVEKALRRHVDFRTASALELWRDLNSPP